MRNWANFIKKWCALFTFLISLYGSMTLVIATNESAYKLGLTLNHVSEKNRIYYEKQLDNVYNYFFQNEVLNNHWSSKEKMHFADVKHIFINLIFIIIGAIGIFCGCITPETKRDILLKALWLQLIILLLLITFFDNLFIRMHQISFNNLYWMIYPKELSYQLFNNSQFFSYSIFIVGFSIIINVLYFSYADYKKSDGLKN